MADGDWGQVWPIVREVVRAADTYPFDPAMTEPEARAIWLEQPPGLTVVSTEPARGGADHDVPANGSPPEKITGTAKMGPNRGGPGAHIATASFMVAAGSRGRGIGAALCRYVIDWARTEGYAGIQFNAVVATNTAAVTVYRRLGFQILGTVPRAFDHPTQGRVGLHLMYLEFPRHGGHTG
ncbi:N-acetyltransferase GCN5 [Actinoplanes sp. SE50]|uniref:GNAT family N-acetyltransferase n=1 Tax=unclassified Actinoplanes TaxID=2626549 RepID=UPI00023ECA9B|nr:MULTISPECIES: GNAT family N-acetyltransferase [unclassified Actinoplanes]AEV82057.1 Protein SPT10 [Actinoplanes sp. SE50/110]ATO80456.1 N-acetyltransferase GCN5 [Actinoplanes sp. SE50]SLL97863.1 GCN5 family acetyltransferase [Actinoplanes sp. SE50/110]